MFTGIIEELGKVKKITVGAQSIQLTIAAREILSDLKTGDSVAVNGVCLTAARFSAQDFTADVMPETMRRSGFAQLRIGDAVNLERALTLSSRLGGHIVSGHVDGVGKIVGMEQEDNAIIVKIHTAETVARYVVEKGSVAIDGISLTVAGCGSDWFGVSLIPHTAAVTTLGLKKQGDIVNIENDIIGKYVERLISTGKEEMRPTRGSNINQDFLTRCGF